MATIGVLVPASPGHLNPMGALGRELVRRGHRVVVAAVPEAEPAVRAAGLDFAPLGADEYPPGAMERLHAELGRRRGWDALRYTLDMVTGLTQVLLRDASEVFRSAGADLLLVDMAAAGGNSVAERLGLPFVSVANALLLNLDPRLPPIAMDWAYSRSPWARLRNLLGYAALGQITRPIRQMLAEQRRAWGLPPRDHPNDWLSPLAQVSQQPPEFEFPRRLPPHFHFAGPFLDPLAREPVPFPWEALDGRPLVYASLGTLQNRLLWIFRVIAAACAGLGVQLVISLGGSAEPGELGTLPGAPLVVRSAPQLDLLARARLTITHAGLNTTLESLARGAPLVAIPITNDQPGVAARIAWTGTGLVVPPGRLTSRRLRAAVARVLEDPGFAREARRMAAAIGRCGGVRHAAAVVERVLATGRPVPAESFGSDGVEAG
jgi:zeaxanthin glucosyltransferase